MANKILIIGPVAETSITGGVTVHVSRLLSLYNKFNFKYKFCDIRQNLLSLFYSILKANIIYLHTSNPLIRFILSFLCFCMFKKLIIMIHGDLGRFNLLKNFFDTISIKISYKPILINNQSFLKAIKINKNSQLLSAYIPNVENKPLKNEILEKINESREKSKLIVVTTASNVSFDKTKNEIYGISELIFYFKKINDALLIIADPSGNYQKYICKKFPDLIGVAFFITENINFIQLLKLSDVFIRNTTTDGDSLSIREALELGITCCATDVVSRPIGTILYKSLEELDLKANKIKLPQKKSDKDYFNLHSQILK